MLFLGDLLLRGLYAFYTEHERCGELEGGVEGEWARKGIREMDEHGRVIDIMIDAMQTVAKEKIPKQDMLPALIDFTAMVALIVAGEERLRAVITRLAGRIEDWRAGSFSVSNMETMH